jgi:hypothetical protein
VAAGDDRLAVALRALARVGNVPIHVGLVAASGQQISASGRRELPAT